MRFPRTASAAAFSAVCLLLATPANVSAGGATSQADAKAPHVVLVTGDHEYKSERTMPAVARELEQRYGFKTTVLYARPDPQHDNDIPGLEALEHADLAVFFLRWRKLPQDQLAHIKKYLDSGRPVVGFRTTTHAFLYPKGDEREPWNNFGPDVLGAPWIYHYGHESSTDVTVIPEAADHPILTGVPKEFHVRSWLYQVLPDYPPKEATRLLLGHSVGPSDRKQRQDNPVAWTYKTKAGGRVFATTMGHPDDFDVPAFRRVVVNGIHWALGRPVPPAQESAKSP
jgi:type 1 glutamine amidotransferase